MKKLNTKGFTALEIILILVVVGLLAGATTYFLKHQKKDDKPAANTTSQTQTNTKPEETKATPDPTADWVSYTSTTGKFTLKYPKTWATALHPEFCGDGIFLLGPTASSVGKCGADGARAFGEIGISWIPNRSTTEQCGLNKDVWQIDSTETVTVSGISAIKTAGTFLTDETAGGGQAKGNKTVQYCLVNNNT